MKIMNTLGRLINLGRRKTLQHDETLAWMRFVNPGMLDPGNVWLFDRCLRDIPNGAVVEIGTFCGLSLNHIIHLMRKHQCSNPLFSVDAWEFEDVSLTDDRFPGTDISAQKYRQQVIDTFRNNVELFSSERRPHHIQLGSDAFFEAWAGKAEKTDFFGRQVKLGGPIAFAYIDGDHSYEQSQRDFENIDRYLVPGGYIVFDDSADWTEWGSHKAAQEASARRNYRLVARAPNYCIQKRF